MLKAILLSIIIFGVAISFIVLAIYGIYIVIKGAGKKSLQLLRNKNKTETNSIINEEDIHPGIEKILYGYYSPNNNQIQCEVASTDQIKTKETTVFNDPVNNYNEVLIDMDDQGLPVQAREIVNQKQYEIQKTLTHSEEYSNNTKLEISTLDKNALDFITEYRKELQGETSVENKSATDEIQQSSECIPYPDDYFGPENKEYVTAEDIHALTWLDNQDESVNHSKMHTDEIHGKKFEAEELGHMYSQKEDIVTMEDLKRDKWSEVALEIDPEHLKLATAKMSDKLEGKQTWVGKVIGVTETYIHFYDGTRKWINLEQKISDVKLNDNLKLNIEISNDLVKVVNCTILI